MKSIRESICGIRNYVVVRIVDKQGVGNRAEQQKVGNVGTENIESMNLISLTEISEKSPVTKEFFNSGYNSCYDKRNDVVRQVTDYV